MRISSKKLIKLQEIIYADFQMKLSDEDAQLAGLAILRFVAAKELRSMGPRKLLDDTAKQRKPSR